MMDVNEISSARGPRVERAVDAFDERLRLVRAADLAHLKRLMEAEQLICSRGISRCSAAELDMLARIHVRQGRFEDARKRWEDATSRDPSRREEFEECLRVLSEFANVQRRQRWWFSVALLAAFAAVGIWILVSRML